MLTYILTAPLLPALCAALLICLIPPKILGKTGRALSLTATGLLLTVALTHLIPEAAEQADDTHTAGLVIWLTVMLLIFTEMVFNGKTETGQHDANHCSCPCHSKKHSNTEMLQVNKKTDRQGFTVLAVRPADPSKASFFKGQTEEKLRDNCCNHGLMQHFGHHNHDFNLHEDDIILAGRRSDSIKATAGERMKKALSEGAAAVLTGAFVHALSDGIVISSAFMTGESIGIAVTVAVIAHEIPQQLSNYVLMLSFGMSRIQSFIVNALSAAGSLFGALLFLTLSESIEGLLPFALAVAGGCFLYVALCDILPRLNKDGSRKIMMIRYTYLFAGAALAMLLAHHH